MSAGRTDAELAAELETLALEVVRRLTERVEQSSGDLVELDEVFLLAGQLQASLAAATAGLRTLRDELNQRVRD
jgi:hypothetical protein